MFDEKSYGIKMDKAIEVFSKELSSLRTGRANANMLDLINYSVILLSYYAYEQEYKMYTDSENGDKNDKSR